jgi:hypothetical protein
MLSRRVLIAAFAPAISPAYWGSPVQAAYDARRRRTQIWFSRDRNLWLGELDHDRFQAMPTVRAAAVPEPDPRLVNPRISLLIHENKLVANDDRGRRISTLMAVPSGAPIDLIIPRPAHPDLVAVWSFGRELYFTNNDYRNVYSLPANMGREPVRPEKLRLK